jgi:hypothetical protein
MKRISILMAVLCVGMTVGIEACKNKTTSPASPYVSLPTQATPIESNSKIIDAAVGGSVTLSDGAKVIIPTNVLSQSTTITISKYIYSDAPQNVQPLSTPQFTYKFDSDSVNFSGSVTIILPFDSSNIPGGLTGANLLSEYYDGAEWVVAGGTVDRVNFQVITPSNHFSWWSVTWDAYTSGFLPLESVASYPVPYYYQYTSGWCALTSGSMLLNFYGKKVENVDIAGYFRLPVSIGLDLSEVMTGSNSLQSYFETVQKDKSNVLFWALPFAESPLELYIKKCLSKCQPLIVGFKILNFKLGAAGHAIVITGYDGNNVYINDPSGYRKFSSPMRQSPM